MDWETKIKETQERLNAAVKKANDLRSDANDLIDVLIRAFPESPEAKALKAKYREVADASAEAMRLNERLIVWEECKKEESAPAPGE